MSVTLRFRGAVVLGSAVLTPKTTTIDTLVDVGTVAVAPLRTKHFTFAAATNTLRAIILGSVDGGLTYPATVEAEFDVTAAAKVVKTSTDFYTHLKVQTKPKVGGAHGTLTVQMEAASY